MQIAPNWPPPTGSYGRRLPWEICQKLKLSYKFVFRLFSDDRNRQKRFSTTKVRVYI